MGCLKLYDQEAREAKEKSAFFSGGNLEEKESALKNCYNYYPFGLTFNSYTRSYSKANNFKYNGVELNPTTQIYETLFRGYDPALGRFMQIDPLADFMPGINPYSFGFNNPISFSDPTGLAPQWWAKLMAGLDRIGNILKGDFNKPGRYDKNGTTAGTGNGRRRNNSGGSSNSNSTTPTNSYAEVSGIDMPSSSFAEFNAPLSTPRELPLAKRVVDEVPIFRGKPIPARTSFSENISFKSSSDIFSSYRTTERHMAELTNLLLKYPEMKVFIVGNIGNTNPKILKGNSDEALDQPYFYLNGNKTTARNLMNARARAVYNFLRSQGVSKGQLDYGPGSIIDGGAGKKVSFDLRNER